MAYDLQRQYDHYNSLLFNNELPKIAVVFARLKNVAGRATGKVFVNAQTKAKRLDLSTLKIQVSDLLKRSDQELDAILIHEMIHIFFFVKGDFDEGHNSKFINKVKECSAKVGFEVPVTEKFDPSKELSDKVKIIPLVFILINKFNGDRSFSMVSYPVFKKYALEMKARFQKYANNTRATIEIYGVETPNTTRISYDITLPRSVATLKVYALKNDPVHDSIVNDVRTNGHILVTLKPNAHLQPTV